MVPLPFALLTTMATGMPATSRPPPSCPLPAELPANVQFVAGQDAACAASGVMPGDGGEPRICDVQCTAGSAQGAGGSPFYFCNNGELQQPTITCIGA